MSKSQYNHEMAKAKVGDNFARHMSFIYALTLYDKFDFSFKKCDNCYNKIYEMKERWQDDNDPRVTDSTLYEYARKKGIDVVGFVNSIPQSQKLFMADLTFRRGEKGSFYNINYGFLSTLLLAIPVLKESYRFSNEKILKFFECIREYIDSYCTKQPGTNEYYLTDDGIIESFIEDEGWDIRRGCKVEV